MQRHYGRHLLALILAAFLLSACGQEPPKPAEPATNAPGASAGIGKAIEDAGPAIEAASESVKETVESVKESVTEAVLAFQEEHDEPLALFEQKASGLKMVADFMKDDQLNEIVTLLSEKVSDARGTLDELAAASAEDAGELMDSVRELMTDIRDLDKQYVARLNELQGKQ